MASSSASLEVLRFDEFEANLRSSALRRRGASVRLPDQSVEVLAMLLEHPGELVGREEIRKRLWSDDTFVDFDHGFNNAVNPLRDALGDSAESPRFVETLPRRGYRFIGAGEGTPQDSEGVICGEVLPGASGAAKSRSSWQSVYLSVALAAGVGVVLAIIALRSGFGHHAAIHALAVLPFQNLS